MSKNSIIPFLKDYLINFLTRPFLLDTNEIKYIIYLCSALVYPMRFFDTLYFKILRIITSGILELNGIVN